MTPEDQDQIDAVERDRRRREAILFAALLALCEQAEVHARSAVRLGQDPVAAARAVWMGKPSIEQAGAVPVIAEAMADAEISGIRRAYRMSGLNPGPLASPEPLMARYTAAAQQTAGRIFDVIEQKLSDAQAQLVNAGIKKMIRGVGPAFDEAGASEDKPHLLTVHVERAIVGAHNGGIIAGGQKLEQVTGFRHLSVIDERTTMICRQRNGLMLPKNDPYWKTGTPPLHFNCRSVLGVILGDFTPSTWRPQSPPMEGFGQGPSADLGRFGL